ncbi:MAG: murein biosynthesis integral membrane protein MurJ, partial [Bdellovibrionales bacterium]|nr:murein biosynthesis integral membrane protein MurJ [Bdellovibrionales bacterium]
MSTSESTNLSTNSAPPAATSKVARATGVVSLMTLLSRILGLIRDMAIAGFFGAGRTTDAFFVAFKVPNLLRRLVAEGSLSTAFVPIFVEEREKSHEASREAVGAVTSFTICLTGFLTILGMIFAEEITLLFAPGFATEPEQVVLSSELLRLMFPYIVLVSALALAASILNSLGKFALPALAPALLNVVMIFAVFAVAPYLDEPVFALAWAVLGGGILALLPQLMLLKKLGLELHFRNPLKSDAVRRLLKLMLPSILSASFYQFMVFINTLLASMLVEKSVSWLFYADRLFQFPLGVFSLAVATAVLPELSRHAARKNYTALNYQLTVALRWMTVVTIPATVGLMVL